MFVPCLVLALQGPRILLYRKKLIKSFNISYSFNSFVRAKLQSLVVILSGQEIWAMSRELNAFDLWNDLGSKYFGE